jgi:hypothetical protein
LCFSCSPRPRLLIPRDRAAERWWDPTGGAGLGPYPHPAIRRRTGEA